MKREDFDSSPLVREILPNTPPPTAAGRTEDEKAAFAAMDLVYELLFSDEAEATFDVWADELEAHGDDEEENQLLNEEDQLLNEEEDEPLN